VSVIYSKYYFSSLIPPFYKNIKAIGGVHMIHNIMPTWSWLICFLVTLFSYNFIISILIVNNKVVKFIIKCKSTRGYSIWYWRYVILRFNQLIHIVVIQKEKLMNWFIQSTSLNNKTLLLLLEEWIFLFITVYKENTWIWAFFSFSI